MKPKKSYKIDKKEFNALVNRALTLGTSAEGVKDKTDELRKKKNTVLKKYSDTPISTLGEKVCEDASFLYKKDFPYKAIGDLTPYTLKRIIGDGRWKRLQKVDPDTEIKIAKAFSRGMNDIQIKKFYPEVSMPAIRKIIKKCIVYQEGLNGK